MEKTDQEIVAEYLAGRTEVFAMLVNRHMRTVYTFTYNITGSAQDSEDITADTFVKAWKNLKKYKQEFSFKTWLLTIARNTAYDFLRKRKHVMFSDFENEGGQNFFAETLTSDDPSALEEFIKNEDKEVVRSALEKLNPEYREILDLRYGEELTFEEIAEILGKPMNTVKSSGRRALIALRKIVEGGTAPK